MKKSLKTAFVMTTTMAAVGVTMLTGSAHASTYANCEDGAVCIYAENADMSTGNVTARFWSYGAHNLSNQNGSHMVYNHQTGGASITLCYGYNGTNCTGGTTQAGAAYWENLTPINSIVLNRS